MTGVVGKNGISEMTGITTMTTETEMTGMNGSTRISLHVAAPPLPDKGGWTEGVARHRLIQGIG